MNLIAINGSPRKNNNTHTLLQHAMEGAKSKGANSELFHLYDLNYKGCTSCFACKLKGGKSYANCAMQDDLKDVLQKIKSTDAVIIGSPIYFGMTTGEVRSFLERLMFPYLAYDGKYTSLFDRKVNFGFIYTMNVNEQILNEKYKDILGNTESVAARVFGHSEVLYSTETYQFDDYSKYEASGFNKEERLKRHKEVFPIDCEKAFNMGKNLI